MPVETVLGDRFRADECEPVEMETLFVQVDTMIAYPGSGLDWE